MVRVSIRLSCVSSAKRRDILDSIDFEGDLRFSMISKCTSRIIVFPGLGWVLGSFFSLPSVLRFLIHPGLKILQNERVGSCASTKLFYTLDSVGSQRHGRCHCFTSWERKIRGNQSSKWPL